MVQVRETYSLNIKPQLPPKHHMRSESLHVVVCGLRCYTYYIHVHVYQFGSLPLALIVYHYMTYHTFCTSRAVTSLGL